MERTVKSMIKRFASLLLAIATLASVVPTALANPAEYFSDFPTGWSRPAMEAAVDNGLLMGIGGDQIGPKKNLTRAEMAAVMVRAFGATTKADVSNFTDLDENSWYYDSVVSAVKMGALAGVSSSEMAPNDYITREQVFSILARILALDSDNADALSKFVDGSQVSSWARSTVIPMVERGYVNGDDLGRINPQAYITREEFAQVMYTTIKKYITEPGTYEEDLDGIVVLRTGDITLKGAAIFGDLVVGDGAAKDLVVLDNVSVDGRLLTRGGTIELKETKVDDGVVVLNPNGITRFNNYRSETVFKDIKEHTKAQFLTPVSGGPSGSVGDQITVNFYKGYGLTEPVGSPVRLILHDGKATVPSNKIPNIDAYYWDGKAFDEHDYMPSDYPFKANKDYKVRPSFWYKDGSEFKPFDETVELSQDTNVYLMYRKASLSVLDAEIFVRYSEDTRLMDSAKLFAHQTYKSLEKAKNDGLGLYNNLSANVKDVFNGTGLVEEEGGKQYLKPFKFPLALNNALEEDDVKDVVEDRIEAIIGDTTKLAKWPGVSDYLLSAGTVTVAGVCNAIYATNDYKDVIDAIDNNGDFDVKPSNLELLKAIHDELKIITFDTVMGMGSGSAIAGLVNIVGYDVCKDIFDGGRELYCDELLALIDDVESGASASATIPAAFELIFDLIDDVFRPLYDRAENKMVSKFSGSVRYNENPYLKYLVEDHDVISEMFGHETVPAGKEKVRTGYYIKDLTEYAKYMVKLLIAIDDAFSVYGDNGELRLTDPQFDALLDAVFADIYDVHDQIDTILQDFYYHDDLPDIIEKALASVQQLDDIFTQIKPMLLNIIGAYFDTPIYDDLSNHRPGNNSKEIAEILTGREDVTFTIDSLYEALGNNEPAIQSLLGGIRTSGSIADIANLLKNKLGIRADVVDGIVDIINNIIDNGFGHYEEISPAGDTTIDVYKVPFGGSEILIKRSLEG